MLRWRDAVKRLIEGVILFWGTGLSENVVFFQFVLMIFGERGYRTTRKSGGAQI